MSRSKNPRPKSRTGVPAAAPGPRGDGAPAPATRANPQPPLDQLVGTILVAGLLLIPPFLLALGAREAFRAPKLYASGWLAIASLLVLAWGLRRVPRVDFAALRRLPALAAVLPYLALATLSLVSTQHPIQVREGLADLWIGAACLVGWSAAFPARRFERLLTGTLVPAALLALVGVLQYFDLWQPLALLGLKAGERLAVTSFAGNPGDLGAYLVLPSLIAQREWLHRWRGAGVGSAAGRAAFALLVLLGVLCLAGLVLTQTLAALAALGLGSIVFWTLALPRRRALVLLATGAALVLGVVAGVAPLRQRIALKLDQLRQGSLNEVLSGRLDGWQTALWMAREHPLTGVGHGAYRPEFIPAKLALLDRGHSFSREQMQVVFANAHSEPLEVAADLGLPGLAALGWGLWVVLQRVRRVRQVRRVGPPPAEEGEGMSAAAPDDARALAWGGTAALLVLSLGYFPFRVALVAYPALLFLSWVLRPEERGAA